MNKFRRRRSSVHARMLSWWDLWRVPTLLMIVLAIWWFLYRPYISERAWQPVVLDLASCGQPWLEAQGCVIDGDTIALGSRREGQRRVRLIGFDAPELDGACVAESRAAENAKAALVDWINQSGLEWTGGDDPVYDQYGRELRELRRVAADGSREYLSEHMVGRGYAAEDDAEVDWCTL